MTISTYQYFSKFEQYSVEQLKNININSLIHNGYNMLFYAICESKDPYFAERVIQAGINVHYLDNNNLNIACSIGKSSNIFEHFKLIYENGVNIRNLPFNKFYTTDILQYIAITFEIKNQKDKDELVKTQLFLLEKEPLLIFNHNSVLKQLSFLMPEVLKILIDKGTHVFDIEDEIGNNILIHFFHYSSCNKLYDNDSVLIELLEMMTPEQVNHQNHRKENILWKIYEEKLDKLPLLKRYGLDLKHLNINNKSILETRGQESHQLAQACINEGSELSPSATNNFFKLSKEDFLNKYRWDSAYYEIMTPFIKEKQALKEKELILNIIEEENFSVSQIKKQRL